MVTRFLRKVSSMEAPGPFNGWFEGPGPPDHPLSALFGLFNPF
jgi:hypothetical protein